MYKNLSRQVLLTRGGVAEEEEAEALPEEPEKDPAWEARVKAPTPNRIK